MPLLRPISKAALALALAVSATACDSITGLNDDLRAEQRRLDRARDRWDAVLVRDYDYVVRRNCFCALGGVAVRVAVRNDQVIALYRDDTGDPLPLTYGYSTIDGIFNRIQNAIDDDAYRIDASYDSYYGFPTDVFIDYRRNAADDEDGYVLLKFRTVP